jgi:hypothetical protein
MPASRRALDNAVFHAARDRVRALLDADDVTDVDREGTAYGFGSCRPELAAKGWRLVPPARRVPILVGVVQATGIRGAAIQRIARFLSRLFEAAPDAVRIHADHARGVFTTLLPSVAGKDTWEWMLDQDEYNARMFWVDSAYVTALQHTTDSEVIWVFTRAMMCEIAGVDPNPFETYLGLLPR